MPRNAKRRVVWGLPTLSVAAMPQRNEDPSQLHPTPRSADGHRWELIEPMLRQREAVPSHSDVFPGCWSAVKGIRTVHDKHGEWLVWVVYGRALLDGDYERNMVARRTTCPHCGHDAANLGE